MSHVRRSIVVTAPLLLLASAALAHFPILFPATPWGTLDREVELIHAFGHPFEVERAPASRPVRWTVFPPKGAPVDLLPTLGEGEEKRQEWRARYTPKERGDHVVALTGPVGQHDGRAYQDFTKVVLHVPAVQGGWDRVVGDLLEIVPLTRPYGIVVGGSVRAEVLADGQPLAHAEVEVEYCNDAPPEALPAEPFITRVEKTDRSGAFSTTLERAGWWILSASRDTPGGTQRAALWVHVGPVEQR